MISATLDSSVYIRALHFGGPGALLRAQARAGKIRIDISDFILSETTRVLREKFRWNGYMIHAAREKLLAVGNHVSPTVTLSIIKEDPDDDRILARVRSGSRLGLHRFRGLGLTALKPI